jgi:hypothetical protein
VSTSVVQQSIILAFTVLLQSYGAGFSLVVRAEGCRRPGFESSAGTASIHLDVSPLRREHSLGWICALNKSTHFIFYNFLKNVTDLGWDLVERSERCARVPKVACSNPSGGSKTLVLF